MLKEVASSPPTQARQDSPWDEDVLEIRQRRHRKMINVYILGGETKFCQQTRGFDPANLRNGTTNTTKDVFQIGDEGQLYIQLILLSREISEGA